MFTAPTKQRRTRRGLQADVPLLAGRLILTTAQRQGPELVVAVWCPYCRVEYHHGWPDGGARLDSVEHRVAHCHGDSPFRQGGYFIGLLPVLAVEHRRILSEFRRAAQRVAEEVAQ